MELKIRHLPVVMVGTLAATMALTFYISCFYYDNHVTHMLPYISDTGTFPPESCIFSQCLNIMAAILAIIVYLKYRQVDQILHKHNITGKDGVNKAAISAGFSAALGIDIVANFQVSNCVVVHWIGAILTFGGGALYLCVQTHLYFAITPVIGQRRTTQFRLVLSVIAAVSFPIFVFPAFMSFAKFEGEDYTKWKREDGGYDLHQVSSHAEWICAAATLFYILSIYSEFKNISVEQPKVTIHEIHRVQNSRHFNS